MTIYLKNKNNMFENFDKCPNCDRLKMKGAFKCDKCDKCTNKEISNKITDKEISNNPLLILDRNYVLRLKIETVDNLIPR
jgi:ubiquitin C-terminal hydrolase